MILINNEELLRVKCEPVLPDEIGSLVAKLEMELDYANKLGRGGIGLAAPQIGIAKSIAIIRLPKIGTLDLVNAELEQGYDQAVFKEEGCLSFPGRVEDTLRYQEVHLKNGVSPFKFIATGLLAVCIQHELDHLNSTLFMDRGIPKSVVQQAVPKTGKQKPNDQCACGSGVKYKRCHGK